MSLKVDWEADPETARSASSPALASWHDVAILAAILAAIIVLASLTP